MSEKQELINKWDGFLNKIEDRFNEFIDQANQGTENFIEQLEYDSISVTNAWNGIKGQMFSLSKKATDTWDDKMDDLFGDRDDVTSDERMEQYYKHTDLTHRMSTKYESELAKAIANSGRKIEQNVMAHIDLNKIHNCKQCGDKMDIVIYSFMAKNVKCQSCGTVNSYEPDARILALEYYTVTALANEKIIDFVKKEADIEHAMHKLDDRIASEREQTLSLREELTATRKERINTYFNFITSHIKDKEEFYNRKRDERLKWAEDHF